MQKPFLKITRIPYEEPHHLNLIIEAANEEFSGKLEIYCNAEDLIKISKSLRSFSGSKDDHFEWELGSENSVDRFAFYLLLQVKALNDFSRYCIHFRFNKNDKIPDDGMIEFSIKTDLESIRNLGRQFEEFAKLEGVELEWTES